MTNIPSSDFRYVNLGPSTSANPNWPTCSNSDQTLEPYFQGWPNQKPVDAGAGAIMATPHGTLSIYLQGKMRVDMTIDRAVRVINFNNNVKMSINATGSSSALQHPIGKVHQYGSRVEILAHDSKGNNKYAKMWYKGVSFSSERCALAYLIDSAGTRTTTDSFSDMSSDHSLNVFYNESRHGPSYQQAAINILQNTQYYVCDQQTQNWILNNVRISYTSDGRLRIARNSNKNQLRFNPKTNASTITTPFVHTTASLGQTPHLFVRRGERRMHYDGRLFVVRNSGHSSGFDENNMLKVF